MYSSKKVVPPTEADYTLAKQVADWMESLIDSTEAETSDYLWNLSVYAKAGKLTPKGIGIAASAVSAYNRELAKRQKPVDASKSKHVGEVGQRLHLKVRLLAIHESQTDYGAMYIHKFVDEQGNLLTWFGSGRLYHTTATSGAAMDGKRVEPGHEIWAKMTVKRHSEFKGVPETHVSRAGITLSPEQVAQQKADIAKSKREQKAARKAFGRAVVIAEYVRKNDRWSEGLRCYVNGTEVCYRIRQLAANEFVREKAEVHNSTGELSWKVLDTSTTSENAESWLECHHYVRTGAPNADTMTPDDTTMTATT